MRDQGERDIRSCGEWRSPEHSSDGCHMVFSSAARSRDSRGWCTASARSRCCRAHSAPGSACPGHEPAGLRLRDRRRLDGVSADQLILHVAGLVTPRPADPGSGNHDRRTPLAEFIKGRAMKPWQLVKASLAATAGASGMPRACGIRPILLGVDFPWGGSEPYGAQGPGTGLAD
jgi:hypothetical protein